jgi:hypothetical protein
MADALRRYKTVLRTAGIVHSTEDDPHTKQKLHRLEYDPASPQAGYHGKPSPAVAVALMGPDGLADLAGVAGVAGVKSLSVTGREEEGESGSPKRAPGPMPDPTHRETTPATPATPAMPEDILVSRQATFDLAAEPVLAGAVG